MYNTRNRVGFSGLSCAGLGVGEKKLGRGLTRIGAASKAAELTSYSEVLVSFVRMFLSSKVLIRVSPRKSAARFFACAARLACSAREENRGNGAQQDHSIETKRPAINVFQIKLHPLFERKVASPGHLPETCQSRLNAKASLLPR